MVRRVRRWRQKARQPVAGIDPMSPEQDARVTAPSPWIFAAPHNSQAGRASRAALSGQFVSTAVENVV
jgi:hypothetical protein